MLTTVGFRTAGICAALALAVVGLSAQNAVPVEDVRARYTKYEYMVPMRDGVRLFTSIYAPKDTSQKYPFLMTRTPYSVAPYGVDQYRTRSDRRSTSRRRVHLRLPGRARPLHVGR